MESTASQSCSGHALQFMLVLISVHSVKMPHCASFRCNFQLKGNNGSNNNRHGFPGDRTPSGKIYVDKLLKGSFLCS